MTSYEWKLDERTRFASRRLARLREALQDALAAEKKARKITFQAVAEAIGVNRSVVHRQLMGDENLTVRRLFELAWAIGWDVEFRLKRREIAAGSNQPRQECPAITIAATIATARPRVYGAVSTARGPVSPVSTVQPPTIGLRAA